MKNTVLVLLLLSMAPLHADELSFAEPESVGFSSERLGKISEFVEREIDEGRLVGVVTMVARNGRIVHFEAAGSHGLNDDRPIGKDAIFRIYSMTKPITTVAAMILYEEGRFQLGDPVYKYLPEFEGQKIARDGQVVEPASPMTIEQLMTHTAGLTYGFSDDHPADRAMRENNVWGSRDLDEFIDRIATVPLRYEPGTRYYYSAATDVLGALVERLSGMTLEAFLERRLFEPRGMKDTHFNVPGDKLDRIATNHDWNAAEGRISPVADGGQRPVNGNTFFSGGGGLFSTAMDYMIFCEMMRNGGTYNGVRILGPKTVQFMTINHLTDEVRDNGASEFPAMHLYPGHSFGLGFTVITEPGQTQVISSEGAYSWGGAANTKFWIDPEEDMVAILMTQVRGSPWSDHTRFAMKIATYQALTELNGD